MADETPKPKPRSKKRADRKSYIIPDANLAQQSRVFQKLFTDNVAAFNAKDTDLTPAYAADWMATIEAFEIHPTDETMLDEIQVRSDAVRDYINQIMVFVDELEYFTRKAFKTKPRRVYEFAFDSLAKEAHNTSTKFIVHAYATQAIATKYQTELLAAGLPPAFMTDFTTLLDTGAAPYINLELGKRERIAATTSRVDLYNELTEYWQKARKAAALVYRNDKEALEMWERG